MPFTPPYEPSPDAYEPLQPTISPSLEESLQKAQASESHLRHKIAMEPPQCMRLKSQRPFAKHTSKNRDLPGCLATGDSISSLAFSYHLGESTVSNAIKNTCDAINLRKVGPVMAECWLHLRWAEVWRLQPSNIPQDAVISAAQHLGNMLFTVIGDAAFPLKS
ncbi:unnamed protein product [Gadus morhua 'NCC']